MLTAMLDGKKILSTDTDLNDRKEKYRSICNDRAICRICQGRILCKFGLINTHHFAHRHTSDCPGDQDTVEHMDGKVILYEFLLSRYEHEASIDIEHYFPDIKMTCDFLIEFNDGSRWAVEFYCGGKEQDLRKKISYYNDQHIKTTWLLSPCGYHRCSLSLTNNVATKLYREDTSDQGVKIPAREQRLIVNTGIDKFYVGNWYSEIVIFQQRRLLPKDSDSLGSLMYFDVEQKELTILRALRHGTHHNIFYYGLLLKGPLDKIIIKSTNRWGWIWYSKQEEELGNKYRKAKKVREELEIEYQEAKKAREEIEAKLRETKKAREKISNSDDLRIIGVPFSNVRSDQKLGFAKPLNKFNYNTGWGMNEEEKPMIYRCVYCLKAYSSKNDMASIVHLNQPEGKCNECNRKRLGMPLGLN